MGLAAISIAAPVVCTSQPQVFWEWVLLGSGTLAGAMLVYTTSAPQLYRFGRRFRAPAWLPRYTLPFAVAVTVAMGLTSAVSWGTRQYLTHRPCPLATQMRIVTYPGGSQLYARLAREFEQQQVDVGDCRRYSVHTYELSADQISQGLASAWSYTRDAVLAGSGGKQVDTVTYRSKPQPDLVITDSSQQLQYLKDQIRRTPKLEAAPTLSDPTTIGSTALVLVRRRTDSTGTSASAASASTLLHVQPGSSTVGALATTLAYTNQNLEPVDLQTAREIRQRQTLLLHQGRQTPEWGQGPEVDLLCRLANLPAGSGQALVTRLAYQLAGGDSPGCSQKLESPQDLSRGARVVHQATKVSWPYARSGRGTPAEAAASFVKWLGENDGRQAVNSVGLCPNQVRPRNRESEKYLTCQGIGAALDLNPGLTSKARQLYDRAGTPRRILMLLDTSGSMGRGDQSGSDLDLSGQLLARIGTGLAAEDQVRLWGFPGSDRRNTQVLLADSVVGPPETFGPKLRQLVAGQKGTGDTPLSAAVEQALGQLGNQKASGPVALLVLTDGPDLPALDQRLTAAGIPVHLIALDGAGCPAAYNPGPPTATGNTAGQIVAGSCQQLKDDVTATADNVVRSINELG